MTRQEEIKDYFAGEYCRLLNQEYCSDCKYIKGRPPQLCPEAYRYADDVLADLQSQGVVISLPLGKTLTGCCLARLEPLIK